jgi:hypothetical protein
MNANKVAYFVAVGVVALGLTSEYRQGSFMALHRFAEHSESFLCRATTRAEQTFAVARLRRTQNDARATSLLASVAPDDMAWSQSELLRDQARDQAEILRTQIREQVRAQAEVMRAQAEIRRNEIEQIRDRVRTQVEQSTIRQIKLCPKKAHISVDIGNDLSHVFVDSDDADADTF